MANMSGRRRLLAFGIGGILAAGNGVGDAFGWISKDEVCSNC